MAAWTIYISFLGAMVVAFIPTRNAVAVRVTALLVSVIGLAISIAAIAQNHSGQLVTIVRKPWIPTLGIEYHLAADGISLVMILLTGIAAVAGVLFSWNIEKRVNEFFALYLALIGAVYGVFLSFDLFDLFVFYEIAIIPKYFLIAIWGSTRREYAAMKLVLYSFAGSALVLGGMIAAYVVCGAHSLDFEVLAHFPFPLHFQMWAFPLIFLGFAVLAGMWPFHTWAPTGHAAAPTAASMLLAGVVMKLGAYGCLRVAIMLFPRGLQPWRTHVLGFGSWQQVFAVLAAAGIVYGASIALVQKDLKFVVGYSSVSHMGFVLLGLLTANQIGMAGGVYQMVSHGIIAGLLFAVVGRMVYDRTHTRDLEELSQLPLGRLLPFAAVTFVLACMASVGLPGFSGFIAELEVLIGSWRAYPWLCWVAGVGILIGIAFSWRALQATFFGEASRPHELLPPITLAEKLGAFLLLGSTLALGLFPRILMNLILPALNGPLFESLRREGWR
jgi:NADH-quinone oxidoreductase subunit M